MQQPLVLISPQQLMISPNRYETRLVFSTLSSSMDSGSYECSISIDSNDTLLYVEDSALVNESTTVIVQGELS